MDLLNKQADRVKIVFYTDPLCCWSWALHPHWQQFVENYKDQITYSYCMGGMIPDWNRYDDPFNSVSRPAHMGPIWMEAQLQTGADINDRIWVENPPASSYPACIAVKTAAVQRFEASELILNEIWKAVMVDSRDISRKDVLLDIAHTIGLQRPDVLDYDQFADDYNSKKGREMFRNDLRQVAYNKIGRFPTFTFSKAGKGLIITGYRPYAALVQAFEQAKLFSQAG